MSSPDYAVVLLYAAVLLWIGWRAGVSHPAASELTLGSRQIPTWAVLCSMSATELSAATFLGVPHAAYAGDWFYLQLALGALLGKLVVARHVIPLYHRLGVVTVYGFLAERFGREAQRIAAVCFVMGRILASGVRLFIAALAVAAVSDVDVDLAIVCCGIVAGLYTLKGGIRAVIWTDTLQGAVLLVAALATLTTLAVATDGGLGALLRWAGEGQRMRILHLDPLFSLTDGRALGVAVVGAFFLTLATHSTDHDMVQRLLTTRDGRSGGRALLASAWLNFPLTLLFLAIGTGLAHFYATPPDYDISESARVLPLFALHELPTGLRGLFFAGLFAAAMSSLDSAICAIATSCVADVLPRRPSDASTVRSIRGASAVVTALLIAAAIGMSQYHEVLVERSSTTGMPIGPSLVEFALSSMTILYGGLLGIFALGMLTRSRGSRASVPLGLATGAGLGLALFLHPVVLGRLYVAWPWWVPLAASTAFAVGALGRRPPAAGDAAFAHEASSRRRRGDLPGNAG